MLLKDTEEKIQRIVQQHKEFAKILAEHPKVKEVRQTGTIFAMEWKIDEETSYFSDMHEILYPYFLQRGILMRPLGNIIYLVPLTVPLKKT